jgi:hypothetical protein
LKKGKPLNNRKAEGSNSSLCFSNKLYLVTIIKN